MSLEHIKYIREINRIEKFLPYNYSGCIRDILESDQTKEEVVSDFLKLMMVMIEHNKSSYFD